MFIILDSVHKNTPFWKELQAKYDVIYQYTDRLTPTPAHRLFIGSYKCNVAFRQGDWRFVVERFFYVEELMRLFNLTDCIMMEYDVLVYQDLAQVTEKCKTAPNPTCRMACDNIVRGHPAFVYVPTPNAMAHICVFIQDNIATGLNDMDLLGLYAKTQPDFMHFFPVITEARNKTKPLRSSTSGHMSTKHDYLSEDSDHFGKLFDSLSVGQFVGGIDPRNTGGQKFTRYINETALYQITEMPFQWTKVNDLWVPILDGRPLVTIHVHCKSLASFLSDRPTLPSDDYTVDNILPGLVRNG